MWCNTIMECRNIARTPPNTNKGQQTLVSSIELRGSRRAGGKREAGGGQWAAGGSRPWSQLSNCEDAAEQKEAVRAKSRSVILGSAVNQSIKSAASCNPRFRSCEPAFVSQLIADMGKSGDSEKSVAAASTAPPAPTCTSGMIRLIGSLAATALA